ncbi:MAG: pilus assembly protein PilM [Fidelibacterota bacterium]
MPRTADFRIGIDVGSNALKMVSYHPRKQDELSQLALIDLLRETKVQSPDEISDSHVFQAISEWLKGLPYKKASIRVSLSAKMNNLFTVTIPEVSEKELKTTLFWELGPLLPEPVKSYEYDYQILGRNHKKKKLTLLVGVFEKDRLDRIFKLFNRLGKTVDVLETDTLAALDLFLKDAGELTECTGFLNLGASHTHYAIVAPDRDPAFLFIPFGGNTVNAALARREDISVLEAEELRRNGGEGPVSEGVDMLTNTVARFNVHYQNKFGLAMKKIYVTGGLANDSVIASALKGSSGVLELPCELWDPLGSHFPEERIKPEFTYHFAPALGLVMR